MSPITEIIKPSIIIIIIKKTSTFNDKIVKKNFCLAKLQDQCVIVGC